VLSPSSSPPPRVASATRPPVAEVSKSSVERRTSPWPIVSTLTITSLMFVFVFVFVFVLTLVFVLTFVLVLSVSTKASAVAAAVAVAAAPAQPRLRPELPLSHGPSFGQGRSF
jgi:hypothetical protein